jgi:hypothetical protein
VVFQDIDKLTDSLGEKSEWTTANYYQLKGNSYYSYESLCVFFADANSEQLISFAENVY